MAFVNEEQLFSIKAGADLSSLQHYIVKLGSTEDTIEKSTAASDAILGVLQNKPTSGQMASVAVGGITKVIAGGSVSAGNLVTADSNGKAIATTSGGDHVLGMALQAASTGDIFAIEIRKFNY